MRLRLGAAAAGVGLIAAAVLAYSLASRPPVAGTNRVAPLYDTVFLSGGLRYCQQVPSLPARTDRVQLRVSRTSGPAHSLELLIVDDRGRLARGQAARVWPGYLTVELDRPTPDRGIRHAGACFTNTGRGQIVLSGETKRCTPRDSGIGVAAPCLHPEHKPPGERYRWLVGLRFLHPGSTSWLSERDVILDRFGLSQAGWFGKWAAWLAGALALLAAGLALWWLWRDPEWSR
jgi:hypothetical protein